MFKELELSETDSVLAAYNSVCELVEDTERLQAACTAKEAELAELRGQTAELFAERLAAEGAGEDAVTAAKAMWQRDPQSVAMATLGCDFAEAANPWGCNQYGHRKGHQGRKSSKKNRKDYSFSTSLKNTIPKEVDENGNLRSVDDMEPLEIIKLENEQRDKRAEASENNRKIERLQKELREAEKTAAASSSKKDKRQVEEKKKELSEAKKKQEELYKRLRTIHKIFNPEWEMKASFSDLEKDFRCDIVESEHSLEELLVEEDRVNAANPYGCNQYGHRKGHNGGQSGSYGERKNRTHDNKKATLSDTEADDLVGDMFEIAMEEGGYERLYDAPKEKVKDAIKRELMRSGSREMFGDVDTGEDGNPAKYRWWRKNVKRIVDSLGDNVKSSSTLEELLVEEDRVNAANPYGCNQYGHEWRGKHGEGWKPSGRGGASDKKEAAPEKKEDTQPKREAESPKEKSIEEEAKEHYDATPEQRQVIMQRWKKEVYNAKEAYEKYKDYRKEGQEEYQKEKARLKAELDKAIERFKEKIIESAKMRGWPLRRGQSVANTFLAQIL